MISLVPVNSAMLQGTELDQTLCIWSGDGVVFFISSYFIFHFYFRHGKEKEREDEFEGRKAKKVCFFQVEAERFSD